MFAPVFPRLLKTERLELRMPDQIHAPAFLATAQASFDSIGSSLGWTRKLASLDDAKNLLSGAALEFESGDAARYSMFLAQDGALVGRCGYYRVDREQSVVEIGYWCAPAHHGKGYTSEAVQCLRKLAGTLGAVRAEIRCESLNIASRKVAERAGFTLRNERSGNGGDASSKLIYEFNYR